jgi:hypothetical protein
LVNGEAKYTEKTIQVTGQVKRWYEGSISLLVRVISSATGEIKFSEKYSVLANDFYDVESAIGYVASIGVTDLVQKIYPSMIINVNNDEVIVNIGGNNLQEGAIFEVFREGQQIYDPYTNELLGSKEEFIGLVKITRVESKHSYGQILEGKDFSVGQILKEKKLEDIPINHEPVNRNQNGFKAPWEK